MQRFFTENKTIISILAISILLRVFFLVITPLGAKVSCGIEGLNDEPAHLNYVKYLARQHTFPVQAESVRSPDALIHNKFEYYQPPLYYLLCASVYPLAGEKGILYWGRILSFLFGVASLVVLFDIFRMIGMNGKPLILSAAFASFQLSHVYFCSLLSNDSLSWLISVLIVNLFIRKAMQVNKGIVIDIWIGALLGAGMLVKSSLAIFFPVYIVQLSYDFVKKDKKIPVKQIGILLCAIAVAAPWYIRNHILYSSFFAFETGFGPPGISSLHLGNVHTALNATIKYFFFPMQHVPVTFIFKMINYTGVALIVAHISIISGHLMKLIRTRQVYRIATLIAGFTILSYGMLLTKWFNAEGRYLFCAFGPIMILLFPVNVQMIRWWRYLKIIAGIEIVFGYLYFLLV
jgi:hypothetical protein